MKRIIRNILILALLLFVVGSGSNLFARRATDLKEITVCKNETIWSIAGRLASENGQNIQNVVYDIKNLNNMSESIIYEGQLLLVPIYN